MHRRKCEDLQLTSLFPCSVWPVGSQGVSAGVEGAIKHRVGKGWLGMEGLWDPPERRQERKAATCALLKSWRWDWGLIGLGGMKGEIKIFRSPVCFPSRSLPFWDYIIITFSLAFPPSKSSNTYIYFLALFHCTHNISPAWLSSCSFWFMMFLLNPSLVFYLS